MGNGSVTVVQVKINDHISHARIANMRILLRGYGKITEEEDGRTFLVDVRPEAKIVDLEKVLSAWDQWGYLRWDRIQP
jgi:hypothetical protein